MGEVGSGEEMSMVWVDEGRSNPSQCPAAMDAPGLAVVRE